MTFTTTPTWHIADPVLGNQDIATTSTTISKAHFLGQIVSGYDVSNGYGEFIYLLGVANTVAGSVVTWNAQTYQTTLAAAGTNVPFPIAIAMSANVATQFGWYQIAGLAIAKKTCSVSIPVGAIGVLTAGLIAKTATGKEVEGATATAISSNKAGNTSVVLLMNRPHMQGRIT